MMKNFLKICTLALLLFLVKACSEEAIDESGLGTLTGKVVSEGENAPLSNVKITTNPVSTTVFTDENGEFIIENILEGQYSVQAEKTDYTTAFKAANIVTGQTSNVVFELEESTAGNQPPLPAILIEPAENEILQSVETTFVWSSEDPDDDDLTFTIELRNDQNNDVEVIENITDTTYTYSQLMLGTKYFWQVISDDGLNTPVNSSVGTFEVINAPVDNRFFYVRRVGDNNVIFSSDEAGNEFQLTSASTNSFRPRKNVAAGRIAFFQTTGASLDLYTMKLDGTDKFKVTSSVQPIGFNLDEIGFSWPANSDMIYFPRFDKLYRINTDGQGLELVYQTTDGSFISEVDVNENLNRIVLKTNNANGYNISIFAIDFSGTVMYTVLSGVPGGGNGLNLSVDGQRVLYSYDVSGFENQEYRKLDSRMFIYNVVSGVTTDVSGNKPAGTNDLEPRFSPNEAFAIFTNTSNDGISPRNIVQREFNAANTSRQQLFSGAFMPDWE